MTEVIMALDFPDTDEAFALVDRLGEDASFYKVGLELYTRGGPGTVERLKAMGKRVFLDLKMHDIPNTVAGGVRAASELGADLLTVHTAGGTRMLEAAREAASPEMAILGVTVLTSLSAAEMEAVWGREILSIRDEVARLTQLVQTSGLAGVVASPLEASWIRRQVHTDFLIVTPGIRPAGSDRGDQKRVATPSDAVAAGADYLVVGRAVRAADDPGAALRAILAEVAAAGKNESPQP
jgi:orotidine-5'-phosphate decarboxylase